MSKKLEQKQQRRALEEARRAELKSARRRRNLITYGIIGVVVALVLVLILGERKEAAGPVGVAAEEAGCGDVESPPEAGANHVEGPVNYQTNPPTSGDHWAQPAESRFYAPDSVGDPPPERAVHNLEHGQIVIWYNPQAPAPVIDDVDGYLSRQSGNQSLALLGIPYPPLEEGNLAMAAWGHYRVCDEVSEEVIDEFRANFQGRGPENVGVPTFSAE